MTDIEKATGILSCRDCFLAYGYSNGDASLYTPLALGDNAAGESSSNKVSIRFLLGHVN